MKILTGTITTESVADTLKTAGDIAKSCGSTAVMVNATKVAGENHLKSAVTHAVRSFSEGTPIARTLEMEILVYVSGQRQCSLASGFGLHQGINTVYVIIYGGNEEKTESGLVQTGILTPGPVTAASAETLMREYDITPEELAAAGPGKLEDLVIERVALIDAWK